MKKPFLNPFFQFLDDNVLAHCHHRILNHMGFDYEVITPEELQDMNSDEFIQQWDLPEVANGYTLVGMLDFQQSGPRAIYVRSLTPFAEELLALGLRRMRTAEYATLAKRPSRQRDWMGLHVILKRTVSNENTTFPAGIVMKVVGAYRGLTLETVQMYSPSGVFLKHRISKVPVEWVDLVVVPFEGGHE